MAFKIIKEEDPLKIESVVAVIYGEPGIGKSSLSFTSRKPLLEDYDNGVQRAVGRKDFLFIEKWEDAIEFHRSNDFVEFASETLIIDTAGSMLDRYIASYVIRQDAKNGRSGGEISLQGYGAMKTVFQAFVNDMRSRRINIIFICHAETQKEGDNIKFIPKMTGGSYDIMMSCADMVGYMESRNNKRTIDFNSTDRHIGKNTAEFKLMDIPHYTDPKYSTFMLDLIDKTMAKMNEVSQSQKEAIQIVEGFRVKVEASTINGLEQIQSELDGLKPILKVQVQKLLDEKYMGIVSDNIALLSNTEEFDGSLNNIGEFPVRYQTAIKQLLWAQAKKLGFGYDEKLGKFVSNVVNDASKNTTTDIPPVATDGAKSPIKSGASTKKETATQTQMM